MQNGFQGTLSSKTNVLRVWNKHFWVFCKFLSDEIETFFWKSEAKRSKVFKSKFGHRKLLRKMFWGYLELKNECSERLKSIFQFPANFWMLKLKLFSGKRTQSVQNYWKHNLVIGSFVESGFKATFSSKDHFCVFCRSFSEAVQTIFCEREAKCWKLFKSKFGHRKLLRKIFWSYLELKSQCSEGLSRAFTGFCKFLSDEIETFFWETEGKPSKLFKLRLGHRRLCREMFRSYLELKKECSGHLKRAFFSFLQVSE